MPLCLSCPLCPVFFLLMCRTIHFLPLAPVPCGCKVDFRSRRFLAVARCIFLLAVCVLVEGVLNCLSSISLFNVLCAHSVAVTMVLKPKGVGSAIEVALGVASELVVFVQCFALAKPVVRCVAPQVPSVVANRHFVCLCLLGHLWSAQCTLKLVSCRCDSVVHTSTSFWGLMRCQKERKRERERERER